VVLREDTNTSKTKEQNSEGEEEEEKEEEDTMRLHSQTWVANCRLYEQHLVHFSEPLSDK